MNSRWRPNFLLHWVVDLFCIFIFLLPLASSTNRDAVVLLRVKDSELQDPNGQLSDWLLSSPDAPCNWSGITCDQTHPFGDVVSINFTNFGISGINFPADFCRIRTLRNLNISGNNFGGVISPESLSLCSHLHSIDLSSNLFVGDLPELTTDFANMTSLVLALNNFSGAIPASYGSRLPKLQVLGLFGNLFNGSIPEFFSNLTELIRLEIGTNPNFQPSQIPAEIGRLKKLENLWLAQTNLHGSIPESIGNLTSLTNLDLSENSLTGKIPASIGALTAVTQIELYGNQLSGEIPNIFGNLTSLINFDASENNLTGRIPKSLTFLPLETLHLNDNHLEGEIPENLGLNDRIWQLRLFNNSLSGSLPMNLGLNSGLQEFDVSGNLLEGPLPMNLCFNNQLEILVLFDNKFSGKIPQSYSDCSSLTYVRISNNELSGVVPAGFWSLPNVTVIDLKNNALEGSIPHTVSNAGGLLKLHVSNNRFSGDLPDEICELEELVEMDISRNQFSGELPSCITKLKKLQKFTAQENVITGRIPSTVNAWIDLTELNISDNLLTGEIPYELGALRVLTYLDLSDNQLTGEIPAELTKLRLNKFNLSNNKLQGRVPSGWEISISGLMGNPDLCSPHLKPIPPCRQRKPRSPYLVGILSALAAILLGSFIWLLIKSKKLLAFGSRSKKSWKITAFQRVGFDEEEILASLTRHNLIATGGSGQVYRINLKNGQVVAVKRLWEAKRGPESEEVFQSEVETLGNIRHGCIVKLLFSCSGDDFRVLVYEYMENGSLGDVLHGDKGGTLLDWPRRLAIARGAAQGLAYMHHDCVPTIVHRDVKSNNILLDEEFNPKVADFGLAKTLQKNAEDGVQEASKIAGSYGYIAPEYAYTLKITEKSDVYSFGVVLWELITGKRPIDPSFGENKDIVKWVNEVALSSPEESGNGFVNLNRLIDPRLNRSACNEEEIKLLVNVAFQCTSALPINRPSMRRVVELFKDHSRVHSK